MVNRDAPMSGLANLMAMKGRMGDTELVHMSKPEIRGLASLGQLTVNPNTGLPEAFNLLPVLGGIAGGILLGPAGAGLMSSALGGAVGTGLGGLLSGQSIDKALFGAALSYGMGSFLGGDVSDVGNITAGADPTASASAAANYGVEGLSEGAINAGIPAPNASGLDFATGMGGDAFGGNSWADALTFDQAGPTDFTGVVTPKGYKIATDSLARAQDLGSKSTLERALSPEVLGQELSKPKTYLPVAGALASDFLLPDTPYEAPEKKPTTITPQEMYVAEEGAGAPSARTALEQALYGGAERQGPRYGYRNLPSYVVAKSGGLISLAEGGMPKVMEGGEVKYVPTTQSALKDALLGPSQQMIEPYRMRDKELGEMSSDEYMALFFKDLQKTDNPMGQYAYPLIRKLSQQSLDKFKRLSASPQQNGQISSGFNVGANVGNTKGYAEGGVVEEQGEYFEGRVEGNGDGMSDEVEYEVEGEDPDMAMLSRDEYVLPADVVAILGNGSSEAGADKLDMFIKQTRKKAFGTEKQQKEMKGDGGLSGLVA